MGAESEGLALLVASRTSANEAARAAALRRQAGVLLWQGALLMIEAWNCDTDPDATHLYADVLAAIGEQRKGMASKIKTVALATRDLDLHPHCYGSLSEAYRNARRLAETPSTPPA